LPPSWAQSSERRRSRRSRGIGAQTLRGRQGFWTDHPLKRGRARFHRFSSVSTPRYSSISSGRSLRSATHDETRHSYSALRDPSGKARSKLPNDSRPLQDRGSFRATERRRTSLPRRSPRCFRNSPSPEKTIEPPHQYSGLRGSSR
jgi:hypothetical protein